MHNTIRNYGHPDKWIRFVQNLRGKEDYNYRYSLNAAVLCVRIVRMPGLMPGGQARMQPGNITDIMKTIEHRYVMAIDLPKRRVIGVEEPDIVAIP